MIKDRERAEDEMYNRLTEAYVRDGDTDVPDPREVFCDILTAVRAERDEEWDKAWVDRRRLLEKQFNLEREEWAKAARELIILLDDLRDDVEDGIIPPVCRKLREARDALAVLVE